MAALSVRGLCVAIDGVEILRDIDLDLFAGRTCGIVGESGCGKSLTALTLMGMLPPGGRASSGKVLFDGTDLLEISEKQWRTVRGGRIALVMQDPFTALNPMMRIGDQVAEALILHRHVGGPQARRQAVQMLSDVGIPSAANSARRFPHQLSGGQRQRAVIAMAFITRPSVLIADEPTTALDVTLQAQILHLIGDLQKEEGTAVLLITHDIGVVASVADTIHVFYAGRILESGPTQQVLNEAAHPYTRALLGAIPTRGCRRLSAIPGGPPRFTNMPAGCPFAPRCAFRFEKCSEFPVSTEVGNRHYVRCWLAVTNDQPSS